MAMINIGGNAEDASYRYKMPKMVTKIEGRGNGIKTVIVNMVDIAKALKVNPAYPTKFFGIELGAQSKFGEDQRAIVNGAHQQPDLAGLLNKFITQFVLCPKCKYPEITLEVTKKETIRIDCAACGLHSALASVHHLVTYIVKHPPNNSKKMQPQQSVNSIKGADESSSVSSSSASASAGGASAAPVGEYGVEWATDSSKEAADLRKKQEFAEMTHDAEPVIQSKIDALVAQAEKAKDESANKQTPPVLVLKIYMLQKQRTVDEIFLELKRLQLSRDIDDVSRVKVLLDAIIDAADPKTVVEQFAQHADLFKKFTKDHRGSQVFLWNIEELVALKEPKLLPRLPLILQKLYDCDVLDEGSIVEWFESPPESNHLIHDKEVGAETRAKAKAFVTWLQSQDSSDEEEE